MTAQVRFVDEAFAEVNAATRWYAGRNGKRCAAFRTATKRPVAEQCVRNTMRVVARRIQHFNDEIEVHDIAMKQLLDDTAPQLVAESGFGYATAAMFVIAWSHPGRCRSEAVYARLGGVAPIPANSGQSQDRHRLNRYGDAYSAAVTTLSVWSVVFVIVHLTPRVF